MAVTPQPDTSADAAIDDLLAKIAALSPRQIQPGLSRIHHLLDRLGNPHHKLPPVIHVAGTNGKGSVISMLAAIFEAAGQEVHHVTSPILCIFGSASRLAIGRLLMIICSMF